MVTNVFGNVLGSQNSYYNPTGPAGFPMAQGTSNITSPFGVGESMIRGVGTAEIGPFGISTSVPFAPGFSATPANTVNGLGLASPFATQTAQLSNLGMNSFGQTNPFSPSIGTPVDLNNGIVMATGAFGGYQNPMSPYAGSGLPQSISPDGSFGYGGPGGSQPGHMLNSMNFGGLGMGSMAPSPMGGYGGGMMMPPPPPSMGSMGPMMPSSAPTMYGNPNLFAPTPQGAMSGIAQNVTQQGDGLMSQYNLITDGVSRLFTQGNNVGVPRQQWGSGSILRSPLGIYETGIGWAGGNANAGLMGAQASGMSWAMTRNPINPSMIVSYANPYYNNYNFNQGFTNA